MSFLSRAGRGFLVGAIGFVLLFTPVCVGAASATEAGGWRLGPAAWSFNRFTFFEAVDKTAALGLRYIEPFEGQRVRAGSEAKINAELPDEMIQEVRSKLEASGVKIVSIYIQSLPGEAAACRKAFEFCHKLGIQTIVSEPAPEALNLIEKLCDEYQINVAIHNHPEGSSRYWNPREVLKACEGRSPRLGACADVGHWQRSGIKPVEGARLLGSRLIELHVKDLDQMNAQGHDVPWGTGQGDIGALLREVQVLRVQPTLFAIEYEYNWDNNSRDIARCAEFFQHTVAELAHGMTTNECPLFVGWGAVDITPPRPVALVGQLHKRISNGVRDPLTATILALETRSESGAKEQAVMVSCDLLFTPRAIQERLQGMIKTALPDLDASKLFLNATHTHTGPGLLDSTFGALYDVSKDAGVMKASEYAEFFLDRVSGAVAQAWTNRNPAGLSWALGHAVVGTDRRAHYFDGSSVMYGNTSTNNFSNIEGAQDEAVNLLFFWGPRHNLSGMVINLACTSQETENLNEISADFWHDVREEMRRRHGPELFILPQCAPAGDQSPHLTYRKQAEQIMDLQRGLSRRKEIARRIVNAVDEALAVSQTDIESRLQFKHVIARVDIPEHQPPAEPFYETDSVRPMEFHVLRLGDVALATNPFELYLDYATRIQGRSRAVLTMLVQLAGGQSGYLPTARAVQGGGYSADKFLMGPEGGQVLVEETVKRINELWP